MAVDGYESPATGVDETNPAHARGADTRSLMPRTRTSLMLRTLDPPPARTPTSSGGTNEGRWSSSRGWPQRYRRETILRAMSLLAGADQPRPRRTGLHVAEELSHAVEEAPLGSGTLRRGRAGLEATRNPGLQPWRKAQPRPPTPNKRRYRRWQRMPIPSQGGGGGMSASGLVSNTLHHRGVTRAYAAGGTIDSGTGEPAGCGYRPTPAASTRVVASRRQHELLKLREGR